MTDSERELRWRNHHKEANKIRVAKSTAHRYINTMAQPNDLDAMARAIRVRRNRLYKQSLSTAR